MTVEKLDFLDKTLGTLKNSEWSKPIACEESRKSGYALAWRSGGTNHVPRWVLHLAEECVFRPPHAILGLLLPKHSRFKPEATRYL